MRASETSRRCPRIPSALARRRRSEETHLDESSSLESFEEGGLSEGVVFVGHGGVLRTRVSVGERDEKRRRVGHDVPLLGVIRTS
jgi:hypothetical protein